jgi:multiple sugar transport system permease protein
MPVKTALRKQKYVPARLWKQVRKEKSGYLFILPHFVFFTVFFLAPVIWGLYYSLFNYTLFDFSFWGLKGYFKLLGDRYFWIALRNTAYYTAGVVPLWLIKALIISVLLFPFATRTQTVYKSLFYLPHVSSLVIVSMIWLWLYEPQFGLFNYLLKMLHLPPQVWLGNRRLAMPSIIFMQVVMGGGSTIVLVSAALASIPPSFIEVARIEGASPVQVFFRILLPSIKPIILYLVVMGTIRSFQAFTQIYVLTRGGPEFSTTTMVFQIYRRAFIEFDIGLSLAQSVLMMGILVVMAVIQFKWLGGEVEY